MNNSVVSNEQKFMDTWLRLWKKTQNKKFKFSFWLGTLVVFIKYYLTE